MRALSSALCIGFGLGVASCEFDRGDRWLPQVKAGATESCEPGVTVCSGARLLRCSSVEGGLDWVNVEDCAERGQTCSTTLKACASCEPNQRRCEGDAPTICSPDGSEWQPQAECNVAEGSACREGVCLDLCSQAASQRSNVGCEYWAVDLDNANVGRDVNAAAQQYAVVISNPQPDVPAFVRIYQDDTQPGEPNEPLELTYERIAPKGLRVFPLGPREVDGSGPGEFNTGTHTALTRNAYRVVASVPVVAVQFNPLDNVGVFSNDASLLKPVESLRDDGAGVRPAYVVLGWPQTIARTDDPLTNFGGDEPPLRAFLTLVGTRSQTQVRVTPTARTLGAPGVPETQPGETLTLTLDAYDVLNLETDDFNADLTGTLVEADGPIVAFSGSEASDAPWFEDLSERDCCADHLEEQLDPLRTAGKKFVAPVAFNRSLAVANAGGGIGVVESSETFRVIAASEAGARITTTLGGEAGAFELTELGDFFEIVSSRDFILESDAPVMLGNISHSQEAVGVPRSLPGGDPSFLLIPPVEQFRNNYVFLTPSSYAFDFLRIIAPPRAQIVIDQRPIEEMAECTNLDLSELGQTLALEDQTDFTVYRCQLGFPELDTSQEAEALILEGTQNDGVHTIVSSHEIGVLVDGFDRNVSYAYAAGTELVQIVAR